MTRAGLAHRGSSISRSWGTRKQWSVKPRWGRMVSIALFAVVFAAVTAVVFKDSDSASAADGGRSVDEYFLSAVADQDGTMRVTIKMDFNFGDSPGHGPTLTIPVLFDTDDESTLRRYDVDDVRATSETGAPADVRIEDQGSELMVYIGDADIGDVDGVQQYTITYTLRGLVNPGAGAGGEDEIYWNVLPDSSTVPISNVRVIIAGPAAVADTICFAGPAGSTTPCTSHTALATMATFAQDHVAVGDQLTVDVAFPANTFVGADPILVDASEVDQGSNDGGWEYSGDDIPPFEPNAGNLGLAALLAVGGTPLLVWLFRRGKAPKQTHQALRAPSDAAATYPGASHLGAAYAGGTAPGAAYPGVPHPGAGGPALEGYEPVVDTPQSSFAASVGTVPASVSAATVISASAGTQPAASSIRYEPPLNARPGLIGTLIDDSADNQDLTASIIDLAVRGHVRIVETSAPDAKGKGGAWALEKVDVDTGQLVEFERTLLGGLFPKKSPTRVDFEDLSGSFATTATSVKSEMYGEVTRLGWYHKNPQNIRMLWMVIGFFVAVLAFIGAVFAGFWLGFAWSIPLFVLAVLGIAATAMGWFTPARTPAGEAVLTDSLAFKRYLQSADPIRLLEVHGPNVFSAYLPYAIVFGIMNEWVARFVQLAGQGVPMQEPTWYVGSGGFWANLYFVPIGLSSMTQEVDRAVSKAATTGSSGGSGFSGGGSSGGGGGGGGGVGGW